MVGLGGEEHLVGLGGGVFAKKCFGVSGLQRDCGFRQFNL